jgi:hypothetical protein
LEYDGVPWNSHSADRVRVFSILLRVIVRKY